MTHPDVIVVGAGLAGLQAAWNLEQKGFKVVVLEARGRVGGRGIEGRAGLGVEPLQLGHHLDHVLGIDAADALQAAQVAPGQHLEVATHCGGLR